jgi:hypothetical protein
MRANNWEKAGEEKSSLLRQVVAVMGPVSASVHFNRDFDH